MNERQKQIMRIRKLLLASDRTVSRDRFLQLIPDNPIDAVSPDQLAAELNLPGFIVRSWTRGLNVTSDGRIWKYKDADYITNRSAIIEYR